MQISEALAAICNEREAKIGENDAVTTTTTKTTTDKFIATDRNAHGSISWFERVHAHIALHELNEARQ